MRCKGEAAFAIAPCACVVKNRLLAGWDETDVLSAFYAADMAALDSEVWVAERVLTGYWPCDPRLYFMFSAGDCRRLALIEEAALLVAERDGWRVLFYARDALND